MRNCELLDQHHQERPSELLLPEKEYKTLSLQLSPVTRKPDSVS